MNVREVFIDSHPHGPRQQRVLVAEQLVDQEDVGKLVQEGAPKDLPYIYIAICRQGDTFRRFFSDAQYPWTLKQAAKQEMGRFDSFVAGLMFEACGTGEPSLLLNCYIGCMGRMQNEGLTEYDNREEIILAKIRHLGEGINPDFIPANGLSVHWESHLKRYLYLPKTQTVLPNNYPPRP